MSGACLLLAACVAMPAGKAHLQSDATQRDLIYARPGGRELHLDLYRARARKPTPVLVYVHGGGWTRGARPVSSEPFTTWLANGISVVAIEYRLAGEARAPAAVQDVRCALAWVAANAVRHGLDRQRIVLQGGSAGGQLALLAAFAPASAQLDDPTCPSPPPIAAVLDYFGIADLTTWHPPSGAVQRWLWPRADFRAYAWKLSPLHHVRAGLPPVFVVHGDSDPTVPPAQSHQLVSALQRAGVTAQLHTVQGGGHGDFNAAQQAGIDAAALRFLRDRGVLDSR
jgi:acetyl esterase/lipase